MQNKKDSVIKSIANVALFLLILGTLVTVVMWILIYIDPNSNEVFGILLSLLCGIPVAIGLFVQLKFTKRSIWYKAFGLPILIIPLLISLWFAWLAFQESPSHIFKDFVADPIPAGVSDIQARNATEGFDEINIILAFKATPEVIDKLIADKGLVQVQDAMEMDDRFHKFTNIDLNQSWTIYQKNYSQSEYSWESITIWVNPKRNTVLFQYLNY